MSYPTGAELLRLVMDSRLLDVHTALPCEVKAFDAAAQTVDVQPMIKNVVASYDGGELEESYPLIRAVPIIYPRSGSFFMAFPLEPGDIVTVIFNEWSIDQWIEKGQETHPVDLERHGFSGAVAFPGGPYSKNDPISETVDALLIGEDGNGLLRIADDGSITLAKTGETTQPAALADDVKAELDALKSTIDNLVSAYNAHTHVTTATVGPSAVIGTLLPTTSSGTPHGAVGAVGSSKVEVQE